MRIGNESLLNHPIAAFVGPRDGLKSQDKQRFTDAIDHWLDTGGVVLTGGALGSDALAIEAAMNWAYENRKDWWRAWLGRSGHRGRDELGLREPQRLCPHHCGIAKNECAYRT